ncbi:MAG: hypothetical protein RIG77_26980 [Cyclobacteriaceae bacterium]
MYKYQTAEEYYNRIYIVFNGLIAITLVPFVIVFLDIEKNGASNAPLQGQLTIFLSIGLSLLYCLLLYISVSRYKKGLSGIQKISPLREKLNHYYSVSLKKYLGLTFCCLLCVVGLFLTRYFLFSIGYVLALVVLSIGRPVLNSIMDRIPLSDTEIEILKNKDTIN